jgi:hypothetical protein
MRYLVISRIRGAIVGDMVPALQQRVGAEMQRILRSGSGSRSTVRCVTRFGSGPNRTARHGAHQLAPVSV